MYKTFEKMFETDELMSTMSQELFNLKHAEKSETSIILTGYIVLSYDKHTYRNNNNIENFT